MPKSSLKQRLYTIIFQTNTKAWLLFDTILLIFIFLSVVLVMLRSVDQLESSYTDLFQALSRIVTVVFTVEYIVRIWVSPKKWSYILSFYGIIDFLSILPSYFGVFIRWQSLLMLRSLRLLRLFRILNLWKYETASSLLIQSLRASRTKISVFLLWVLLIILVVWTLMYLIEWEAAGFTDIPTAVYRAIVTITTVWYGDITPQTWIGQLISASLMLLWYGIIAIPTGLVSAQFTQEIHTKKVRSKKDKKQSHKK